jgi:hypothetical protein
MMLDAADGVPRSSSSKHLRSSFKPGLYTCQ